MLRRGTSRLMGSRLDIGDKSSGQRLGLLFDTRLVTMTWQEPRDKIGRRMGGESSESVELVRRLRIVLEHDVR